MANPTNTRTAWEKNYKQYLNLNQRLEQAPNPQERDRLQRAVAAEQDKLLEMSAPSFLAVMHKLEILWEGEWNGVDQASEEKRQILCDLSDLCAEAASTIGYNWSFGSAA